jgi:hypothetical protein
VIVIVRDAVAVRYEMKRSFVNVSVPLTAVNLMLQLVHESMDESALDGS